MGTALFALWVWRTRTNCTGELSMLCVNSRAVERIGTTLWFLGMGQAVRKTY